jgi:hypothetical protein
MVKRLALLALAAAALAAQEKQPPPPPPPPPPNAVYQLEFTLTELEGAKRLHARSYSFQVNNLRWGKMRVGNRIPVVTEGDKVQYMDVGVNIDARPTALDARAINLEARLEVNGIVGQEGSRRPTMRVFTNEINATVPLDKPVQLASQEEPGTNITYQVSVTARLVRN